MQRRAQVYEEIIRERGGEILVICISIYVHGVVSSSYNVLRRGEGAGRREFSSTLKRTPRVLPGLSVGSWRVRVMICDDAPE